LIALIDGLLNPYPKVKKNWIQRKYPG